jgi:hypothetical protein
MTHYSNTKKLRVYQTANWIRFLIIPWITFGVFLSIYGLLVLRGPISWVNTRQNWPQGECFFTNDSHQNINESHYYSASFIVYWLNNGIPTISNGSSPNIIGNNGKDLSADSPGNCTIDPSTINNEDFSLSVWPEVWLHEWQIRYWFWGCATIVLSLLSAFGLTICYATLPVDPSMATIGNAEEIQQLVAKHWTKALKKLVLAQPEMQDNLMIGDTGPFGKVFTCAVKEQDLLIHGDYQLVPVFNALIEDLSLISNQQIASLVQHFYDTHESDLRTAIMSWLEKSGVIAKILARGKLTTLTPESESESSDQVEWDDESLEEMPRWSLIASTPTESKTPQDKLLWYSAQQTHSRERWYLTVIGCLFVVLIFIGAYVGISFLVWNSIPTQIGSAPFFSGMLGIGAVMFALAIEVSLIVILHMVCEQLVHFSASFRNLARRYKFTWFLKVDYFKRTKFYAVSSGEFFSVITARYNISIKRIRLLDEPVWICAVTPKPPSEISFCPASVVTLGTNVTV